MLAKKREGNKGGRKKEANQEATLAREVESMRERELTKIHLKKKLKKRKRKERP